MNASRTYFSIFLLVFFCTLTIVVSAQDERKQSVGLGFSAMRQDFFFQGNYQIQFKKLEFSAGAGIGIIRSIFQGRLYPQLTLRTSYFWLDKPRIQLGPTISLNYSGIKLNNQYSKISFYQQYYAGYCFTAGKRLKFVQITEVGPQFETYYTDYDQRYHTAGNFGYSVHFGLRYGL